MKTIAPVALFTNPSMLKTNSSSVHWHEIRKRFLQPHSDNVVAITHWGISLLSGSLGSSKISSLISVMTSSLQRCLFFFLLFTPTNYLARWSKIRPSASYTRTAAVRGSNPGKRESIHNYVTSFFSISYYSKVGLISR